VNQTTACAREAAQRFTDTLRGLNARHVAAALNCLTPGTNWSGCSKAMMASAWGAAQSPGLKHLYSARLRKVDLVQLQAMAAARAAGDLLWHRAQPQPLATIPAPPVTTTQGEPST
jgi:hypothetical protein